MVCSSANFLWNGSQRRATGCNYERRRNIRILAYLWKCAECRNANTYGNIHAFQHFSLQFGICERARDGDQGDTNSHLADTVANGLWDPLEFHTA